MLHAFTTANLLLPHPVYTQDSLQILIYVCLEKNIGMEGNTLKP